MLLDNRLLAAIETGEISILFRRWKKPRVKVGTRQRTAIGIVEVTELTEVEPDEITPAEVAASGFDTLDVLLTEIDRWPGQLYRVGVRYAGPDPRVALRDQAELSAEELEDLRTRLSRMDSRADRPWTWDTLELISANTGRVSTELAAQMGLERQYFKQRVRRLKELGLTESLEVGYRISPRGQALLASKGQ